MAERLATNASDPSVDGALIAWHEAGQPGVLVQDGQQTRLGGAHPALGPGRLAVVAGSDDRRAVDVGRRVRHERGGARR